MAVCFRSPMNSFIGFVNVSLNLRWIRWGARTRTAKRNAVRGIVVGRSTSAQSERRPRKFGKKNAMYRRFQVRVHGCVFEKIMCERRLTRQFRRQTPSDHLYCAIRQRVQIHHPGRLSHLRAPRLVPRLSTRYFRPFRYVTPIRAQCGITRSEIPRFASLLSWITDRYGWDGIRVLDESQLAKVLSERLQNGHLAGFIASAEGYAFVGDVARNVLQYQRCIVTIEDLRD